MSDYIPASISIGGNVLRKLVPGLLGAIDADGLKHNWGEPLLAWTAERLLEQAADNDGLLWLCDEEARGGSFDELEEWLEENDIPFDRRSDAKFEYDGGIQYFRPGLGVIEIVWRCTTQEGNPLISHAEGRKALHLLKCGGTMNIEAGIKVLEDELGPDIPDLPPFQII